MLISLVSLKRLSSQPVVEGQLSVNISLVVKEISMRITLNIDDELLAKAQRVTGLKERTALVREGLKALIERESARRLAQLGSTEPQLQAVPRR